MGNALKTGPTKILIVEDEAIIAMEIRERLESRGWIVCGTAITGDEAVRLAETTCPDAVLMDITLKGGRDGFDTAREIRRRFGTPVVFITASLSTDVLSRIGESEPPNWVSKPFDEKELFAALEEAVALSDAAPGRMRIEE